MWAAANTSIKISVVHFYITIFRSNRIFLTVAYVVMLYVVALGVAIVSSDLLTCRPLSLEWDLHRPGACNHRREFTIAFNSCNIGTDLIIILLPMPLVWGLRMDARRKIELTVIFALGCLYAPQHRQQCSMELTSALTEYALSPLSVSLLS